MKEAYDLHTVTTEENQWFEDWRNYCEEKFPQFRSWSLTLKLELMIFSFLRSIRVGSFALYKEAIQCLLPWFFALDHIHYARWLSVHLVDMLQLGETNPQTAVVLHNAVHFSDALMHLNRPR